MQKSFTPSSTETHQLLSGTKQLLNNVKSGKKTL